jgi:tRNA dimethylallyltransferase
MMGSRTSSNDAIGAPIHVIVGPTAAGKTRLALDIARRAGDIEIVSADSRQIYIGMDIGTAKPSAEEMRGVPHHMIDIITPDVLYSAGRFAGDARIVIDDIIARGRRPLVVGGSGFYVKALFEGLGAPTVDEELLERLKLRAKAEGSAALYDELVAIDPDAARAHSPNNLVKTLRALCCYYQTGRLFSSYAREESIEASRYRPSYLAIAPERALLYERIDRRVVAMLDEGLIRETEMLLARGYERDAPGLRTVGYAEAIAYLAGEIDYDSMVAAIQQSTRRYAKRQMTWFKRVEGMRWVESVEEGRRVMDER